MPAAGKKKIMIFGVPLDLGSQPLGVKMGPSAIRYAGLTKALSANGFPWSDYGDVMVDENTENGPVFEIIRVSNMLAGLVTHAIEDNCIPIVLGGDHSVSIGSMAGAAKTATRLGVIWLDCHPDANTPETSPSGNIHGMPVAVALGYGMPELVNCAGFSPKILPENICIIGAKDMDQGEKEFLDRLGVTMFTMHDITQKGIVAIFDKALNIVSAKTDALHVSFDIDVLDPVIAPGSGIMSRGGLSYREISYVMKSLGEIKAVSSMDVIEINPLLDIKNQTSELAVELILSALGGRYGDYERHYLKAPA